MSALALDERARALCERLAPYARGTLEQAARDALRLHADELAPEHLLCTLLGDEEAGATRLVLFAFADPETLAAEVLAMSPGIMVVGSRRTLPFSVRGVRALEEALDEARGRGAETVEPLDLLRTAWDGLADAARAALEQAGAVAPRRAAAAGARRGTERALLRYFSDPARRALGQAARRAARLGRAAIAPAHVLAGVLAVEDSLATPLGLDAARVEALLAGRDDDPTPPERRSLAPDERLRELLAELPHGADTLAVLGWFLHRGPDELRELFRRQKVTPELHSRAGDGFGDP